MSSWYDYIPNLPFQAVNLATGGSPMGMNRDKVNNWLFGGQATQGMATAPQTADFQRGYLKDMLNRQAPTMDASQSNQARGQQSQLANMLMQTASGNAPGAGEMAVNRQVGQANAQQVAGASMARGADAALAGRTAARNMGDISTNGAGMAGQAALQDRSAAQGMLGQVLGGMRGQDIGVAQGNQQANMQQQQLQISALAQMLGVDEATLQQELAKRKLGLSDQGMLPGLLQVGGQIGAAYAGK